MLPDPSNIVDAHHQTAHESNRGISFHPSLSFQLFRHRLLDEDGNENFDFQPRLVGELIKVGKVISPLTSPPQDGTRLRGLRGFL